MTQVCIAGFTVEHRSQRPDELCHRALAGLRAFGSHPVAAEVEKASFGAVLAAREKKEERPLAVDHRFVCVADARIDNKRSIRGQLNAPASSGAASLILAAWSRWNEATPDHLVGEYAFAIYDRQSGSLFLVRDPSGYRPLFYSHIAGGFGFASMPSGLMAGTIGQRPNLHHFSRYLDGSAGSAASTFWKDIHSVPAGSILRFSAGKTRERRFLCPSETESRSGDWEQLVQRMRDGIDRAVTRNLEGAGTTVAGQLSSGLDSSAVVSTAARCLEEGRHLIALTAVPSSNARLLVPRGRYADESALAAETAGLHGVEHILVCNRDRLLPSIRGLAGFFQQPAPAQYSFPWWRAMSELARDRGCSVLLTGGQGNAVVSYGGLYVLPRYLARGRFGDWWNEMCALRRNEDVRWRGMIFNSAKPLLPGWLSSKMLRLANGRPVGSQGYVRREWRERPADKAGSPGYIEGRLAMIRRFDAGTRNRGMFALTGVEERDPLADRELIDLSLSLPPEAFLKGGRIKPLIKDALADRVPPAIVENRLRGVSGADWYDRIDPQDCRDAMEDIKASPSATQLLDLEKLERAIDDWPAFNPARAGILSEFGHNIGRALSTGLFLAEIDRYPLDSADRQ